MVSKADAKEIAGKHVEKIVGGQNTGYSVETADEFSPYTVTVNVWKVSDTKDNPSRYIVEVDSDGNITDSYWK